MQLSHSLTAFAAVFTAELPDKTMVTVLVLTTRFRRPRAVWAGAACAFVIHVTVAVTAGRLISFAPEQAVKAVVTILFTVGAIVLWREAGHPIDTDETAEPPRANQAFTAAFVAVLLAEWGDLTQLATASLAARTSDPVGVGLGALAALWAVAALAATVGQRLVRWLPVALVRRVAAVVFAVLAVVSAVEAIFA